MACLVHCDRLMRFAVTGLFGALVFASSSAGGTDTVPVLVRNVGRHVTRVQLALGVVLPCDSPENTLLYDGSVRPSETVTLAVPLGTVRLCARSTHGGSAIDFGPSAFVSGGVRCTGPRGRWCAADATVPFRVDVGR